MDLAALKQCQSLGREQPIPAITEDTDYRKLAAVSLGTIEKGNRGVRSRTNCENGVIAKYEAAGK